MLYGNTSYLASPTTPHVVPIMANITFDVSSVVINVITNTICCFSVFCRDDPLLFAIFLGFFWSSTSSENQANHQTKPTDESLYL